MLTLLSSTLLLLAWEERRPRLDQVGGSALAAMMAMSGERIVGDLSSMVMVR